MSLEIAGAAQVGFREPACCSVVRSDLRNVFSGTTPMSLQHIVAPISMTSVSLFQGPCSLARGDPWFSSTSFGARPTFCSHVTFLPTGPTNKVGSGTGEVSDFDFDCCLLYLPPLPSPFFPLPFLPTFSTLPSPTVPTTIESDVFLATVVWIPNWLQ